MYKIESIGHLEATVAVDRIKDTMQQEGLTGVIAIADAVGELIMLIRLDNSPRSSILIASNKAWTAAREKKSTGQLGKESRDSFSGFDMAFFGDSRYIGWAGGVPIIIENRTIGAVAVSGLTQEQDERLALLGAKAILNTLS